MSKELFSVLRRTPHQQRVDEFMRCANQAPPESPTIPDEANCILRGKLMLEEVLETIEAMGLRVLWPIKDPGERTVAVEWAALADPYFDGSKKFLDALLWECVATPDMTEVADGCADVSVVTTGTLSAFGIADEAVLEAVDESNMRKFGPGGHQREDGKWDKAPGWKPPDLAAILQEQRDATEVAKSLHARRCRLVLGLASPTEA